MCTALHIHGCFGRTLDLEHTHGEQVVLTPRGVTLAMRHRPALTHHYAMLGMTVVADGFPLYYDGVNECGLAMAGLNFPHSAVYAPAHNDGRDVASFELIPYVLGGCATIAEAKEALADVRVCDTAFSAAFPPTGLHWMVADATASIVVESTAAGLQVYDNPIGVMTNEPPFPDQLAHWATFAHLTANEPAVTPPRLGRGSGSLGLPGDFTSPSRLVRAAFMAAHSEDDGDPIGAFVHAIETVAVPRGCLRLPNGQQVMTQYTSCMSLREPRYIFRTYDGKTLRGVRLSEVEGQELVTYPLPQRDGVCWEN